MDCVDRLLGEGHTLDHIRTYSLRQIGVLLEASERRRNGETIAEASLMRLAMHADSKVFVEHLKTLET